MFLFVKGARAGVIKGESQDSVHANEIDVVSWSWGMEGHPTVGGTGRAARRELKIVKRIDSATTPLMSALRTNEPITKAVLTLRKSGKTALEYLKITIEEGRVMSLVLDGGDLAQGTDVFENVSFTFNRITVEYVPQGSDGQARGSMMFVDQFGEAP
jgi:type VI secretion system secreted protein Hcp